MILRIVVFTQFQYLVGFLSEDKDIVIPHQFMDLHICTVIRSQRHCTIQHKLHVAGTGCFLARQ